MQHICDIQPGASHLEPPSHVELVETSRWRVGASGESVHVYVLPVFMSVFPLPHGFGVRHLESRIESLV